MLDLQGLLEIVSNEELDIYSDSRLVTPNSVFVAISGNNDDGSTYVPQAIALGALYIVCESKAYEAIIIHITTNKIEKVAVICYDNIREALWRLASSRYKTDKIDMLQIGITGTNGKTTTVYLLESIFKNMGYKVGIIGTVGYQWPGYFEEASLTTPDTITVHKILRSMCDAGVKVVIMEVSSHAITQERAGGISFDAAIFTNLTQDHLDYHLSMEDYFKAKSLLFTALPSHNKCCVINSDDTWGKKLLGQCHNIHGYGFKDIKAENYLQGEIKSISTKGMTLEMNYNGITWQLNSLLVGKFNAYNLLATQALCLSLGFKHDDLLSLETFRGVCGRLESVENPKNLDIFVDYAHTPDALINVLKTLQEVGFKRIITVFGCGGNRDKGKRPLMAKAASEWSNLVILTSDNPRNEKPEDIIADAIPGINKDVELIVEADRELALKIALKHMNVGDALLVAGKGHESYQIINNVKHHFSDQETIMELLK